MVDFFVAASVPRQNLKIQSGARKELIEGNLEVKLPTIWTDGTAEAGRVRKEKKRSEKIQEGKMRRKKMRVREKAGKSCVFPRICGSRGPKSRFAKVAGAELSGQMRHETWQAAVARSTFGNQKTKNTSRSDRFWKLRCQKSARRCGAKHVSTSKV